MTNKYGDETVAVALKLGEAEVKRITSRYNAESIGKMAARILISFYKELEVSDK